MAQLQEQVALKDAEIERLHSQLSRTAALHSDHAEKGNWLTVTVQLPLGPVPWTCMSMDEYVSACCE